MVDQELLWTLQSIAAIASTIGVVGTLTAAFIAVRSYINANKRAEEAKKKEQESRDRELETRQTQLFMQLFENLTTIENMRINLELMDLKWSDLEDYKRKYDSTNNPEVAAKRLSFWYKFDNIGYLYRIGVIDRDWAYAQLSGFLFFHWVKYEPVIMSIRRENSWPNYLENWEYMMRQFDEVGKAKGFTSLTVRGFTEWIPDQKTQ